MLRSELMYNGIPGHSGEGRHVLDSQFGGPDPLIGAEDGVGGDGGTGKGANGYAISVKPSTAPVPVYPSLDVIQSYMSPARPSGPAAPVLPSMAPADLSEIQQESAERAPGMEASHSADDIPDYPSYNLGHDRSDMMKELLASTTRPVEVTFHKLKMEVATSGGGKGGGPCSGRNEKSQRTILHGIDGVFQAGKFTAIMGASGAGKTTLLNAVAGEAAGGRLSGHILLNGKSVDSDLMRKLSVFVFQDDVILATMTVREVVHMSATLRLPAEMSQQEKIERVEKVLSILHLEACADTIIGMVGAKGGVSGGERKRTAIAMELITDSSVFFLDEPTSGLDTYTAYSVCQALKSLADAGRTVIATIHQPSSDIFHMFDELLLLAHGRIMYQGPAKGVVEYFAKKGFSCPVYTNPADHIFLKILNDADAMDETEKQHATERVQGLLADYENSDTRRHIRNKSIAPGPGVDTSGIKATASLGMQTKVLFSRAFKNALRNRLIFRAKAGQAVFMGTLAGLIWRAMDTNQDGIQNRTGALFFLSVNTTMSSVFMVLSAFGPERVVFERERSHGMYSTLPYFLSKTVVEMPINIIFPFIQGTIAYWLMGLQNQTNKFFEFALTMILIAQAGNALGIMIACIFNSLEVTLAVAPLFIMPLMIFSGFMVNSKGIPAYFDWIKYISPMKYSFEAMGLIELHGLEFHCEDDELISRPECALVSPPAFDANGLSVRESCVCPVTSGEQVLNSLGMLDDLPLWLNVFVLGVMWFGFLALGFILLYRLVSSREHNRAKLLSSSGLDQARRSVTEERLAHNGDPSIQ